MYVCGGQASMTPEERAAAIAKMPAADRAAALVCMHGSCVYVRAVVEGLVVEEM